MRIALVWGDDVCSDCRDCAGQDSGDECGQLCAALASQGHSVTAFPRTGHEPVAAHSRPSYLTVAARVGPPAPVSPAKVLPFVGHWAAKLADQWSSEQPDIVHSIGWLGGLAAQLAARRHQLVTIQSFYGLAAATSGLSAESSAGSERARLEPLLIRSATWVTGGSSEELDAVTKLRHDRARASVLSTGIDVERYACPDLRSANAVHRILQVAPNLQPCNGFDLAIQVLPHLTASELVVAETSMPDARDQRERAKLKRLATELGVSNRVRFCGHVGPEELPSLLQSADVVACTPRLAPRASSALQAMASSKAVVGTAVGALRDTVIVGVTGLLVSSAKPHELATALKSMQNQRFQRESMGSAGRSRVVSRFTWDRIALDALNIYDQASHVKHSVLA